MAEHTSTRPHKGYQRMRAATEAKADKWPGGLPALLADYRDERATLKDICRVTGMQYRGACRVLRSNGVAVRDYHIANAVAHKLRPEWGKHISETKRRQAFRHPEHVTRRAAAKRTALFAADPSRHGCAHMQMKPRERMFSGSLAEAGFRYVFNQPAVPYFVDFYLPDRGIVFEVHRASRPPYRERIEAVRRHINPAAIVYVPNHFFVPHRYAHVTRFLAEVRNGFDDLAGTIGDALFLWDHRGTTDAMWRGFPFKRRWRGDESSGE